MCGIAGYQGDFHPSGHDSLRHRGPDARGEFTHDDTRLLHWRLSIIDLSEAGNQPMTNEDGSLWLVFNGEIYNFSELREGLVSRGHRFRSTTDSEVILHLYEEHGEKMLGHLRGMFSFAIFDRRSGEIFIARDPFGIKPLVYSELPQGFLFSSELRFFETVREFPRDIDTEALDFYFRLNYIPAPWTIWRDARKLEPGSYLRVRGGRVIEHASYFSIKCGGWSGNEAEAVDALESVLEESARMHLVSDVPTGAFLSGGLDSSLTTAMAQRAMGDKLKTFTVTFPEFPFYDESEGAMTVARALGTEHTEIPVTMKDAIGVLEDITRHMDEPFADSSIVPTAILCKAAAGSIKVAISGDGGDEFFAGYSKYQGMRAASHLRPIRPILKAVARLPLTEKRESSAGDRVRQLRKFLRVLKDNEVDRALGAMEVFTHRELGRLLAIPPEGDRVRDHMAALYTEDDGCRDSGEIARALSFDARFVLPYDMLHKVDTASMRYSLEVRVPIIDISVGKLAFSFPERYKLRGLTRKWIVRKLAERYLPSEVLSLPKKGFGIPIGGWIRNELRPMLMDTLSHHNLEDLGLNAEYVDGLVNEHMTARRDRFWELWNLFVLVRWKENHGRR